MHLKDPDTLSIHSTCATQTQEIAACLGRGLRGGEILLLRGTPGAGKTTFVQGLARSLGITGRVKSPSFTILYTYETGRIPLYHFDFYRLDGTGGEDFEEYFHTGAICAVEWPDNLPDIAPQEYLEICIHSTAEDARCICFHACGARYRQLLEDLKPCEC